MPSNYKNKVLFMVLITAAVIILDQITKLLVVNNVSSPIEVIKNFFYISFIKNTGAAFGILKNQTVLLIWFSIMVIGVVIYLFDKVSDSKFVQVLVGLILGGTVSNLIDRLRLMYVIDFIDFKIWPAFNIADASVTIGCIGMIIYFWRK